MMDFGRLLFGKRSHRVVERFQIGHVLIPHTKGKDLRRFCSGQAGEQMLVLVRDLFPVIEPFDARHGTMAILPNDAGIVEDTPQLFNQVLERRVHYSGIARDFTILRRLERQGAVARPIASINAG